MKFKICQESSINWKANQMDGLPVSDQGVRYVYSRCPANYDGCISFFQSLFQIAFKLGVCLIMKVVCVTLHVVVILIIRYCLGDRIFSYSFWKLYAIYCQNNKWIKFPSFWWSNMLHVKIIFVKFWDAEAEPRLVLSILLSHDFIIFSLNCDRTDRTGW